MGLFGEVMDYSRSSSMSLHDRMHTTSYSTLIETVSILYCLRDIASHLLKLANFTYRTYIWRPLWGDPVWISRWSLVWYQKTRAAGVLCGNIYVIPWSAVLVQYQLVTDGQTQDDSIYCTIRAHVVKIQYFTSTATSKQHKEMHNTLRQIRN